jgi:hypothetical protein
LALQPASPSAAITKMMRIRIRIVIEGSQPDAGRMSG